MLVSRRDIVKLGQTDFDVIDGQQRLITLASWLAALADHGGSRRIRTAKIMTGAAEENSYGDVVRKKWEDRLKAGTHIAGPLAAYHYFRWILWLGSNALLAVETIPAPMNTARWWDRSLSPEDNFSEYVRRLILADPSYPGRSSPPNVPDLLRSTLHRLQVLVLDHQEAVDEPQPEIFETLNGTGLALQQIDHVRNRVFLRLTGASGEAIFRNSWEPTERQLRQTSYKSLRTKPEEQYLYDFLIAQGYPGVNRQRAAAQLDLWAERWSLRGNPDLVERHLIPAMGAWIAVVSGSNSVAYGKSPARALPGETRRLIDSIRSFSVSSDPLILRAICLWLHHVINDRELTEDLQLLDAYWARHILAGTPLSPFRSKFMGIMQRLVNTSGLWGPIKEADLRIELAKDAPTDATILAGIAALPLYGRLNRDQLMSLFRGIEGSGTSGGPHPLPTGPSPTAYTVEHIAPQKLGPWKADMKSWGVTEGNLTQVIHTLGNLTAATVGHNSKAGQKRLVDKQTRLKMEPPLRLNAKWGRARKWTNREIKARSTELAALALAYWLPI
jgi:hypothetical protein